MKLLLLLAMAAGALGLPGQNQPVFRTHADRVRVDVLVTAGDRSVTGLDADDFRLSDNGVSQRLELLDRGGPVWLVLVLDVSESVKGETLRRLRDGCEAAIGQLQAGDQAALLTFAEEVIMAAPLSDRLDVLLTRLREANAGGRTALFDAVFTAQALVRRAVPRTLIVVYSDGQDNMSVLEPTGVRDLAREGNAVIYGIRSEAPAVQKDSLWLDQVSNDTGGRTVVAGSPQKLSGMFLRVLSEFRSRYVLTYTPTGVGRDDGWHEIEVTLTKARGKLTARRGYQATP